MPTKRQLIPLYESIKNELLKKMQKHKIMESDKYDVRSGDGRVAVSQALSHKFGLSDRNVARIMNTTARTVFNYRHARNGSNVTPWDLRTKENQQAAIKRAEQLLPRDVNENSNESLSNIVSDFVKRSGTGSKHWDDKYGVRAVNAALKYGLDQGLISISSAGNPAIYKSDEYGFKSALRHRNFAIFARNGRK